MTQTSLPPASPVPNTAPTTAPTTVDPEEVRRFSEIAAQWWDEHGKFRPLHKLNPVRLTYIRDTICRHLGRDPEAPYPLSGVRLVDIGCGGGLLAEPLARMGAQVVGIDAAERNIKTASTHAAQSGTPVDYRHTTAEAMADAGELFDVVVSLEVVEHVADVALFLNACARLLKPDGLLFAATLNRTPKSYLMAIIGAEYVLRWLPRGTHDWRRFLRPSELAAGLRAEGLSVREMTGVVYNPFGDSFSLHPKDLDVNYMLWASR